MPAFPLILALALAPSDWLVTSAGQPSRLTPGPHAKEITLSNGLIRRTWRIDPNAATVRFDNLVNGQSIIRSVRPEAILEIDGALVPVGGLTGQPEHAYLKREWLDNMTADPAALRYTGHTTGPTRAPFQWQRVRHAPAAAWPPKGAALDIRFEATTAALRGLEVTVHYEIYDGIPLLAKWITVRNGAARTLHLNRFIVETLAVVEEESTVEGRPLPPSQLHLETDYAFHGMNSRTANPTVFWSPDPDYKTQVNYALQSPLLLEVKPPIGPDLDLAPGQSIDSFRVFELAFDATDRERRGLAIRRMFRTVAPWVAENPILMHVRRSDPASVKLAIDQCAETGFEMVILSFGSGFNMENEDPAYIEQIRQLVDYGRSKGVEVGGYSLLASRKISAEDDVIDPKTGERGHAIFDNSPCLGSRWAAGYFRKLRNFIEKTGLRILEHDGSYPGDVCASRSHPGHKGLDDSQWRQWEIIRDFYQWCRGRGVYLNVPDWYFLAGSTKTAMGYREINWSLPRSRQIILARQNIFDGTWDKTPSMGWMFVPLVQYHGGGAEATLEPLSEHLTEYEQHLVQNFSSGVQACYRGPRLYDTDATKQIVSRWTAFYKANRAILDSDVIHLRRADSEDWDGLLHVNPALEDKGMAILFNPLDTPIQRTIRLPLYYTGITGSARIRIDDGPWRAVPLARDESASISMTIPARGWTRITIRAARN